MHLKTTNLRPVESAEIERAASWLATPGNYQWLDFGHGHQRLDAISLRIMVQRDLHLLRIFTPEEEGDDTPIGLVALSDINRAFRTATVWVVLGDKRYGARGITTRAVSRMVTIGFEELDLRAINAWTLECNTGGRRILEELKFHFIGRQRQCHVLDGKSYDRLWYDQLAEEHKEL